MSTRLPGQLISRYRRELFGNEDGTGVPDNRTSPTPWGPGAEVASDMVVTSIQRRSAWPETQMVLDLYWAAFPDRRFVVMLPIWPPAEIRTAAPRYNEVLWFNLMEHLHTGTTRILREQTGPIVYDIGGTPYDLHLPALGPPPAELLAARREATQIKRGWSSANPATSS